MSRGQYAPSGELGFEAFGTACGLAVVTGALSLVAPRFAVLTATLVALALAGWTSRRRRAGSEHGERRLTGRVDGPALAALAAAAGIFAYPPTGFAPWRALVLGLAVVPLWWVERHRPSPHHSPGRERR